ncbi:MAG: polyribonucleotide nucleotidyltransferase [Clostridia bacterium]|nr:polyribonucleotide nucleotidyltransferase [Clostridia bacterium]
MSEFKVYETTLAGRKLIIETGKFSALANGSVTVRYGETVVMANVTAAKQPREGIDFFPLAVDFEERMYSVGKIPGGYLKREGRPSEKAILASRLIDRPIRPLFPKDLRNDVVVAVTVLSVDPDNSPEIAGMIAASAALSISDIPFDGPIGGVSVGLVENEIVINPTLEQRGKSDLNMTVAATAERVCMIEAGANEVPEDIVIKGIFKAHEVIKETVAFIKGIQDEIGKEKFSYESFEVDHDMYEDIKAYCIDALKDALDTADKQTRDDKVAEVLADVNAHFEEKYPEMSAQIGECLYKLQKETVRDWIFVEGKRVDGRTLDQIRPLSGEVGLLPRAHGTGLFQRGLTQVLTVATLGPISEVQRLDGIDEEESKRYMHHYNFPPYSVGEARSARSPGRREIGHGALAERALEPVIPSEEEFPYAIRLVSEVLSSNGSTSQGSICGSTLALMDAGVPIKAPVAGISCGLVTKGDEWVTMVDIQGIEDFFGDMDFKVGGTKKGVTAIQMDIKIKGLPDEVIEEAIYKTRDARYYILDDVMAKIIDKPRDEVSKYAPKMLNMTIDVDKIREVIGQGGKVIQRIIAETGVKIDINDDGSIYIACVDKEAGYKAMDIINAIVNDPEPGQIFKAKVTKIMAFGAFVEYAPGKEGLVHISKLDHKRVEKVEDIVSEGDEIIVKVLEKDRQGRINLSRKDALPKEENDKTEE